MAKPKPKIHVVLMHQGEIHGGTDSIVIEHRRDKVIFANGAPGTTSVFRWETRCPFKTGKKWNGEHKVTHGQPLMMRVAGVKTAPNGKYRYRLHQSKHAGAGPGQNDGGGDVIIRA